MPPDTMSTVMPMERMPSVETCCKTFLMFRGERKPRAKMLRMTTRTIRTRMIPHC